MPWPNGPPSSDCPVGWHTDDAPRRHRVRTPARMGLTNHFVFRSLMIGISPEDCRGRLDPFPRYLILRPKRRFSLERPGSRPVLAQNQGVSPRASRRVFFSAPKTRSWVFRRLKRPVSIENLGIACPHSRRVFFRPQKHAPGFLAAKTARF